MPLPMTEEKAMERIKMLLRKAEATDSPEEAETFSEAAEKMMLRLNIDRAAAMAAAFAEDGRLVEEAIVQKRVDFEGTLSLVRARMLGAIVMAFGCKTVEHHQRGNAASYRGVTVIGHESEVEHALVVWESLRMQGDTALAHFAANDERILEWKEEARYSDYYASHYRNRIRTARKNFLLNFAYGAANRIRKNRHTVETEVKGTGTDLVLVDRAKAVERYYEDAFSKLGKARDVDADGYGSGAGYRAGQAASTGERQFAGRKALGA